MRNRPGVAIDRCCKLFAALVSPRVVAAAVTVFALVSVSVQPPPPVARWGSPSTAPAPWEHVLIVPRQSKGGDSESSALHPAEAAQRPKLSRLASLTAAAGTTPSTATGGGDGSTGTPASPLHMPEVLGSSMLAIRSSTPAHIAAMEQFTERGLRWLPGVGARGWRRLQAKVSRREPISVVAFGGSNTKGTKDARLWERETYKSAPQARPEGSVLYHEQFRDGLASAGLNVTVRNNAVTGFGSCQTAARIKAGLFGAAPDLVIFEFSVNDEPEFHAEANEAVVQGKISECFESMARTVLGAFPGAALLNLELEWPGFPRTATSHVSHAHQMVADYYGYPQLRLDHDDDTLTQAFGARSDIRIRAARVSSLYQIADGTVARVAESEWRVGVAWAAEFASRVWRTGADTAVCRVQSRPLRLRRSQRR